MLVQELYDLFRKEAAKKCMVDLSKGLKPSDHKKQDRLKLYRFKIVMIYIGIFELNFTKSWIAKDLCLSRDYVMRCIVPDDCMNLGKSIIKEKTDSIITTVSA